MGHYCRLCGRNKPNEKFSGKGHRTHICKACSNLPKSDRDRLDHLEEMYCFWQQKNISKKNKHRLLKLSESESSDVSEMAKVLYEVASLYPLKKNRIRSISRKTPDLIARMESVGLILNWDYGEAIEESIDVDMSGWDEYCEMVRREF